MSINDKENLRNYIIENITNILNNINTNDLSH